MSTTPRGVKRIFKSPFARTVLIGVLLTGGPTAIILGIHAIRPNEWTLGIGMPLALPAIMLAGITGIDETRVYTYAGGTPFVIVANAFLGGAAASFFYLIAGLFRKVE